MESFARSTPTTSQLMMDENLSYWCHACSKKVSTHRDQDWNVICKFIFTLIKIGNTCSDPFCEAIEDEDEASSLIDNYNSVMMQSNTETRENQHPS